jgi:hypothetical protein
MRLALARFNVRQLMPAASASARTRAAGNGPLKARKQVLGGRAALPLARGRRRCLLAQPCPRTFALLALFAFPLNGNLGSPGSPGSSRLALGSLGVPARHRSEAKRFLGRLVEHVGPDAAVAATVQWHIPVARWRLIRPHRGPTYQGVYTGGRGGAASAHTSVLVRRCGRRALAYAATEPPPSRPGCPGPLPWCAGGRACQPRRPTRSYGSTLPPQRAGKGGSPCGAYPPAAPNLAARAWAALAWCAASWALASAVPPLRFGCSGIACLLTG